MLLNSLFEGDDLSNKTDMTGKPCKKCHKGKYHETSHMDDWDGVLHCTKCGAGIKRWVERKVKEDYDPEEADTVRAATKNIQKLSHTKKNWKDAARNLHDISIWDKAGHKANKKAVTGMDEGETGPTFTGYWKGKDANLPGKKMVGGESVSEENNPADKVTMDIPLFIRMLEYAKEDAKTDMDLHNLTERAIQLMQEHEYLCMDNYDTLVGGSNEVAEATTGSNSLRDFLPPFTANGLWVSDRHGNNVLEVTRHGKVSQEVANALNSYTKTIGEGKIKGKDGKACWDGYRYNGTKNGKDSCVKVNKSK